MQAAISASIKLQERLTTRANQQTALLENGPVLLKFPELKRPAVSYDPPSVPSVPTKIRIAKRAESIFSIFFFPRPQVTTGKTAKNRRTAAVITFSLNRVKYFLDTIHSLSLKPHMKPLHSRRFTPPSPAGDTDRQLF